MSEVRICCLKSNHGPDTPETAMISSLINIGMSINANNEVGALMMSNDLRYKLDECLNHPIMVHVLGVYVILTHISVT